MTSELKKKIDAAFRQAEAGMTESAEKALLEIITGLGDEDADLRGKLYVNLGTLAENLGRLDAAIRYFEQAILQLEDLKGESILQNAHAHFNVTRILLTSGLEEAAADVSTQALKLYQRYPLTSKVDLLDARVLDFVCQVYASSHSSKGKIPLTPSQMNSLWASIIAVPFNQLNIPGLQRFLLIYFPIQKQVDPEGFKNNERLLKEWAGDEFAAGIRELMQRGDGPILLSSDPSQLFRSGRSEGFIPEHP